MDKITLWYCLISPNGVYNNLKEKIKKIQKESEELSENINEGFALSSDSELSHYEPLKVHEKGKYKNIEDRETDNRENLILTYGVIEYFLRKQPDREYYLVLLLNLIINNDNEEFFEMMAGRLLDLKTNNPKLHIVCVHESDNISDSDFYNMLNEKRVECSVNTIK